MTPTTQSIPAPKQKFRDHIAAQRAELTESEVRALSHDIAGRVLALGEVEAAYRVAAYLALPYEVQLDEVIAALRERGKRICVPAFHAEAGAYRLAWLDDDTPTTQAAHGVVEPLDPEWVNPGSMDLLLVPGVAFDRNGNRIGHGSGTYDRLLHLYRGYRVGVAFEFQLLDSVPVDPHDIGVDVVVTPARSYVA